MDSLPSIAKPPRTFRHVLWKVGLGATLFIVTAAITSMFMAGDKNFSKGAFGGDLVPGYVAGKLINEGRADLLFNPHTVSRMVGQVLERSYPDAKYDGGMSPWMNPPFFGLLFVPLAKLSSYPMALGVWMTFNTLLTVASGVLLTSLIPRSAGWSARGLVPLGLVTAFPFVQTFTHQQSTYLSLTILSIAIVLAVRAIQARGLFSARSAQYSWACGLIAGLMFFKPQLGLGVVLALSMVVGYRVLLGAVFTGALLMAIGEWTMPGSTAAFFIEMPLAVATLQERRGYGWQRQTTLMAFWRIMFQGAETGGPTLPIVRILLAASVAGVITMLAVTAHWVRNAPVVSRLSASRRWLAGAIACVPLVMPYYMDYDLLLLVAGATLLATDVLSSAKPMEKPDRTMAWTWVALWAWLLFQPPMAGKWPVNITVLLIAGLAGMMLWSVRSSVARGLMHRVETVGRDDEVEYRSAA